MATIKLMSETTLHFQGLAREVARCLKQDRALTVVDIERILSTPSRANDSIVQASCDEIWEALLFL